MSQTTLTPSRLRQYLCLCGSILAWAAGSAHADLKPDLNQYQQQVQPLLAEYCVRCHGAKTSEAKIRFDVIDPNIITGEHFGQWEDVREAFNSGEMPPEDEPQPTDQERDVITRWLDTEFKKAKQHGHPNRRGNVRRMTRYELRYALEDLLHVSIDEEINALPEEGTSLETGLKNSSRLLMISGPHLESYLDVILAVIDRMKQITAFEPYAASVDIANLDPNPAKILASNGKSLKSPVGKIERAGQGVILNAGGGYIDLPIPAISRCMFQTLIKAKADSDGIIQVAIGFQYSDVDPRQKVQPLGNIDITASEELVDYTLNSYPENLPAEMSRALDRPFFIRITNRGVKNLYLESYAYRGNVNTELTSTLIPHGLPESQIENHVRQSILAFIGKAFRRAPTEKEFAKYFGAYQRYAQDESSVVALLNTYKEILCSPNFFYLGLPGALSDEARHNYKLAEKLSFFLWCSVPDDKLLKAASRGELTDSDILATHVERMLADEKSRRWVNTFADQWLQTSKLYNVAVDRKYYPRFRDSLKELMHQETLEAVNDVFRNNSSALNLLNADHVFVNQALASFYQIKGIRGEEFRKVTVNENQHRGGLLTQGTFLVGNSDGMNSHAILRGVWLSEVLLNDPPPDPPKNVPPLDESIPGFDKMTLNEKLFAHRNNAACKNCHQKIDPWGIPFENYDASGSWREKVLVFAEAASETKQKRKKKPTFEKTYVAIDRAATLPGGATIDGMAALKEHLATQRKHDFAKGLTIRILAYALSRDIDYYDEDVVTQLCDQFEQNGYSVPILIREIVRSEPFQRGL